MPNKVAEKFTEKIYNQINVPLKSAKNKIYNRDIKKKIKLIL